MTDLQKILCPSGDPALGLHGSDLVTVNVGTDQEACADLMSRYDLIALPVINDKGVLLGIITVDDVLDVMVEEATEDIQKMGGAQPLGVPYLLTKTTTVFQKASSGC